MCVCVCVYVSACDLLNCLEQIIMFYKKMYTHANVCDIQWYSEIFSKITK